MASQQKTHTVKLEFFPDDLFEYCKLEVILRAYIKRSRPVPPEIVRRFLEVPDRAYDTKASMRSKLLGEKCALAQSHVQKYKQGFEFKAQKDTNDIVFELPPGVEIEPNEQLEEKANLIDKVYSSDDMIASLFKSLFTTPHLDKLLTDKVKMTNFIAREFETYLSSAVFFEEEPISVPSINKRCKIAGCVLLSFGLIVDEETFKGMITAKQYYKEHLATSTYHLYTRQVDLLKAKTTKRNR